MAERELCKICGAALYDDPALRPDRLCPTHLAEARANTPPFVDGTRVTPGSERCYCDGPCPECPSGKPRKNCRICDGYGTLCCEFPCWQRIGLTSEPCCPSCAPLPEPEPVEVAPVTSLASPRQRLRSGMTVSLRADANVAQPANPPQTRKEQD